MFINKFFFLHQLVLWLRKKISVSCFKNISVLRPKLRKHTQKSCNSSPCKGWPLTKITSLGFLKWSISQGTWKAQCLVKTKYIKLYRDFLHKVKLTFKYQKMLLLKKNKTMKDRLHKEFKEEPIYDPMGILKNAWIHVCVCMHNFIYLLHKAQMLSYYI